jgi:NAD(P)-dependent dehydrogenase (short-subunit alcohol dehydrogenase family)
MFDLTGKTALVTGATGGIGGAIARAFHQQGATVALSGTRADVLDALAGTLKERVFVLPCNLGDRAAVDALVPKAEEVMGKLDILVANAGILGTISPLGHIEAKVFEKVMLTNVTSMWRLIRSVEPLLVRSDAGRALLFSSGAAAKAPAFWGAYAISKSAVETMGRIWAAENTHTTLKVNMVNPGATRTAMRAQAVPGEDPETLPHPSEVAQKILFLASPELTDSGRMFVVRENRFVDFRMPE